MQATLKSIEQTLEMGIGKLKSGELKHGSIIQLEDIGSGTVLAIEVVDEDFVYEGKQTVEFSIERNTDRGKEWVALIKGTDPKFGLKRKFVPAASRDWDRLGREGTTNYLLVEGELYEVNDPYEGRYFVMVQDGEIKRVPDLEAITMAEKMNKEEE